MVGEELLRRDMLSTFEENKIIIFPQTIFYSDTTKGQKEKEFYFIYNRNNLTIVAREYISFERMKYLYPNANVLLTSDIVLSTNKDIFGVKQQEQKGILLCLRSDMEKAMSLAEHKMIKEFLEQIIARFV